MATVALKRKAELLSDEEPEQEVAATSRESTTLTTEDTTATTISHADSVFVPPSVITSELLGGASYTYHSPVPETIASTDEPNTTLEPCVLGVDEAGRGPVLGPMVYGVAYLPASQHRSLLADTYHFDDSKVLTPEFRSSLLQQWCTPGNTLHASVGWAVRLLSARDISAGMLRPRDTMAPYNLNQQAMDATVALIRETIAERGINVTEIYVDTIGKPEIYQRKLEPLFPQAKIVVAKKADSLYPCVSAASVAAKVTRDAALQVLWQELHASQEPSKGLGGGGDKDRNSDDHKENAPSIPARSAKKVKQRSRQTAKDDVGKGNAGHADQGWGSGYPSDARCSSWLRTSMHPVFGWGLECRFSWGTAKDLLCEESEEAGGRSKRTTKGGVKSRSAAPGGLLPQVTWPGGGDDDDDDDPELAGMRISNFLSGGDRAAGAASGNLVDLTGNDEDDDNDDYRNDPLLRLQGQGLWKRLGSWYGSAVVAA